MRNQFYRSDWQRMSLGFSLVEVMVALAALTAIVYVSTDLRMKSMKEIGAKSTRNQVLQSAKLLASSINAVEYSLSKRPQFAQCIKKKDCETVWQGFDLFSPGSDVRRAGAVPGMVSFTYPDGKPCQAIQNDANCEGTVVAQVRFLRDVIEVRLNIRNLNSPEQSSDVQQSSQKYRTAFSDVTTFRLSDFNSSFTCAATQAMVGIDTSGNPVCVDTNLPAGGGSCSGGQVVTGMDADGRVVCGSLPQSVNPMGIAGFFDQSPQGGWKWQACSSIGGLNGVFRRVRGQFTCNWQSNGACSVNRRRLVPQTCTACSTCYTSSSPPTAYSCNCYNYDCSYVVLDRVDKIVCDMSTSGSVNTTSAGNYSCASTQPTNCTTIPLGPYDDVSCPCFNLTGKSGSVQCAQ